MGAAEPFIMIGMSAISAAASAKQAADNNKAVKRARDASLATEDVSARNRRAQIAKQYQAFAGAARVSAGERGVGAGGSSAAIQTAALSTALNDEATDRTNQYTREGAIRSDSAARLQNPLSAGIEGGFDGLMSGMALTSGWNDLTKAAATTAPKTPYSGPRKMA